ncbi:hypothetical protein HYV12_03270 [Candidatus Dojkabacteria bacterium]|nr:hypothetical protein [Candidatus Dojkabacteria bacterium]
MPAETISYLKSIFREVEVQIHGNSLRVVKTFDEQTTFSFCIDLEAIIWPSKEGEFIKDITSLPTKFSYSLSYPGTASTKSLVLFTKGNDGIFIGGKPTEKFCKLSIRRIEGNQVEITITSCEHDFIFIPFVGDWKNAIKTYKDFYGIVPEVATNFDTPKYLLQIGVIAPDGVPKFKKFSDLNYIVDKYAEHVGHGHIVHFFGTDPSGFDRMFPRYEIAEDLGGEEGFRELLEYIHSKGLFTSHHFIPRIADYDWVKENPEFYDATIKSNGLESTPVVELYKAHPFYVMNPNNEKWYSKCIETIKRLHSYGVDYVQLDQFTYQRNFYNKDTPVALGYKKMVEEVEKLGINYWLEGVNDLFNPKGKSFSQILVRNIPNVWDDFELRRGYLYGESYPDFFTSLYPNRNYSYQLITEDKSIESFNKNFEVARMINAKIYDFQMDYYGLGYDNLLNQVIERVSYLK